MPTARNLRVQIEAALASKIPAALTLAPKAAREYVCSGLDAVDKALRSGLACGVITELTGTECSGRTSLALAYVAAVLGMGNVCAWVDVADALCPESVAANGVDLERLLWVRCGALQDKQPQAVVTPGVSAGKTETSKASEPRHTGGGSPHPRSEGRNMPEAIRALLESHGGMYDGQVRREKKSIGTPGAPNRPLNRSQDRPQVKPSQDREEQVNSDRLPPRRGDNLAIAPRCAEPQPRRVANLPDNKTLRLRRREPRVPFDSARPHSPARSSPWQALDQAIRATDLLLQGGGFGTIVLDLGSTPAEIAWRIPLATWFRFRAACERTRTSLLLLTQHPCARSSAELVVRLHTGTMEAQGKVMTGIRYRAATERSRSNEAEARVIPIRKPPQPERFGLERFGTEQSGQWTSKAAWGQIK